jgi:hypothetical protein
MQLVKEVPSDWNCNITNKHTRTYALYCVYEATRTSLCLYAHPHETTPRSRALLEDLIVAQLAKKSPSYYEPGDSLP